MSIENTEMESVKAVGEEKASTESASQALLEDAFGAPAEESRRHRHNYPYQQFPLHIERPSSSVNALQYQVRDGKITVLSR